MLCSRRKWPYVFIANAPPSLCPSQRETVGISTPDSMHRVANKCRKSLLKVAFPRVKCRHSSVGRAAVDHVLFSDSAVRAATNAQQWYVTISRGRKSIQIFTPDKQQLRQAILRSGERELALDLLPARADRHGVRRQILRSLRGGREFARRLCARAMRSWSSAIMNAHLKPT